MSHPKIEKLCCNCQQVKGLEEFHIRKTSVGGRCARCKQCRRFDSLPAPSLDRIDSSLGYTHSNVRVVCYAVNVALGKWGEKAFLQIVDAWNRKRSASLLDGQG